MLELRSLSVRRDGHDVLHDLSLGAGTGALGLLGVNGAGKSTLLETVAGLLPPSSGHVVVDGEDVYDRQRRAEAARRVALVPQEFTFPGNFTVRQFLHHMAWMRAVPRSATRRAIDDAIEAVHLGAQAGVPMRSLSGGMARRAAIAQALLADPDVLLLDESTTGLDPVQRAEVRDLLVSLAPSRCVVLASHIVEDVEQIAPRVVVLHRGRLLFDGSVEEAAARSTGPAQQRSLENGFLSLIGAQR